MLFVAFALLICFAQSLRIGNIGYGKPKDYESSLKLRLPKVGAPFSYDNCDCMTS
jgi:hypothetical protein